MMHIVLRGKSQKGKSIVQRYGSVMLLLQTRGNQIEVQSEAGWHGSLTDFDVDWLYKEQPQLEVEE